MQEEVENKSVMLIINSTKFTGRVLKSAISKYLAHRSEKHREKKMDRKTEKRAEQAKRIAAKEAKKEAKRNVIPRGKQSVKDLIAQNQGVSSIDVADKDMKGFEKIAREYNVDFAVRKTKGKPAKYLVFFKAKDSDALIGAMTEFTRKKEYKRDHPSIVKRLTRDMVKGIQIIPERIRSKRQEHDR